MYFRTRLNRVFLTGTILALLLSITSCNKNLTCDRLPVLADHFMSNHYTQKSMTEEIRDRAVDQMIKGLDPTKTLLYASDVEWLRPVLESFFENVDSENCTSLVPVFNLLLSRVQENELIVREILGPDYRPSETAELATDVKKRHPAKTQEDKKTLLKNIAHFQIENDLLAGIDLQAAKTKVIHRYELQTKQMAARASDKLLVNVAESFALALDPHTNYLPPAKMAELEIYTKLSLEGIGATLSQDNGFTVIDELIPGGNAERSGLLKLKDKIIAVAQEGESPVTVIDMELTDVVRMIRGKKGTQVTLTILRQADQIQRFDVTITRDRVNIKEQEAKITYETRVSAGKTYRFGVIDLPSFYSDDKSKKSCFKDVKTLLGEAKKQKVDGIVLDLSRNGGGYLSEAVQLVGLFIGQGGIVATKDSKGKEVILASGSVAPGTEGDKRKVIKFALDDEGAFYPGPLVVLTSRLSASASEIVAGTLQEYRRAVIVGSDHTFGKGSVQQMIQLPRNLGGMKVTTAMYFLPSGRSTQGAGVTADVPLPAWISMMDIGEATLDYSLPTQSIAPFIGQPEKHPRFWIAIKQSSLTTLASRSKIRVEQDDKFREIIKNNNEAADKNGVIRISDLRKEKKKTGTKTESLSEMKKKFREQYAPYINESVNILLDLAAL